MKILLIGHNNSIAKKLIENNGNCHTFTRLRNQAGLPWRFGEVCNLEDFTKIDRIVFLAWDKSDLELSLTALKHILSINQSLTQPINLLFLSSYSVFSNTRYGISKLFGEEYVNSFGGKFIRSPLIYDNMDTLELRRLVTLVKVFRILPSEGIWGGNLQILQLTELLTEINSWINDPNGFKSPGLNPTQFRITSIHNLVSGYGIKGIRNFLIVDSATKFLFIAIRIWGSRPRILDSILSLYPKEVRVKQRYCDLSL
jgi:hypothetical protein